MTMTVVAVRPRFGLTSSSGSGDDKPRKIHVEYHDTGTQPVDVLIAGRDDARIAESQARLHRLADEYKSHQRPEVEPRPLRRERLIRLFNKN